jgi:hypothetical protein
MATARQAKLSFLAVTQSRMGKENLMLKMSFIVRMKLACADASAWPPL